MCCCASQDPDYRDGAVGIAKTWPQGACVLPSSHAPFDWQGDRPLHLPMQDCVIYEAHMRGFTMHPSSKARNPGMSRFQSGSVGIRPATPWHGCCISLPELA